MKKCFALFLSLALLLSCVTAAFAEEIGVVPYEIAALDTVIYIPENMTVTDETETDENVSITLALNGREDCGFGINIGYSEAYEGYTMLTLPDDARQEMIDTTRRITRARMSLPSWKWKTNTPISAR